MNKNVELWLKALRSGEYRQAEGRLRKTNTETGEHSYCCLGVACQLYMEQTGEGSWERDAHGEDEFILNTDHYDGHLPISVRDWLGLSSESGNHDYASDEDLDEDGNPEIYETTLAEDNDHGMPFSKIADLIESAPDGLFKVEQRA